MEPRRSGLVYGRTAQWRGCRGLFGMVLAEKGGKPGKGKQFSRVACRKGRNRLPLSLVNDTAEVLKRGLGSFSASCLFPVTGLALGGGGRNDVEFLLNEFHAKFLVVPKMKFHCPG